MSTTKIARLALHELIIGWFRTPDAGYTCPIYEDNIINVLAAPEDDSESPNWIFLQTVGTLPVDFVTGDDEPIARMSLLLASRHDGSLNSQQIAQSWIDDAEELMVMNLSRSTDTANWIRIRFPTWPRRDIDRDLYGRYKSSHILIEVELK